MPIITDALNRFGLNRLDLKDILFLTGTGISAPNPTRFLLGREAHAAVLENFTTLSATERSQVLAGIPFEKSCDAIQRTFQGHPSGAFVNVFWNMMSELFIFRANEAWKQTNELHAYFREHVRQGGKHITANLDQFIEKEELFYSVRTTRQFEDGVPYREEEGLLYKFHGDFTRDFVDGQGFVISAIDSGFSPVVQTIWEQMLGKAKLVVVCGYGGVDIYDVIPYFRSKASGAFGGCVLWTCYGDAPLSEMATTGSADSDMMVSKFRMASIVKGRAGDVLNGLPLALPRICSMTRTPDAVLPEYTACITQTVANYEAQFADFLAYKQLARTAILNLPPGP